MITKHSIFSSLTKLLSVRCVLSSINEAMTIGATNSRCINQASTVANEQVLLLWKKSCKSSVKNRTPTPSKSEINEV